MGNSEAKHLFTHILIHWKSSMCFPYLFCKHSAIARKIPVSESVTYKYSRWKKFWGCFGDFLLVTPSCLLNSAFSVKGRLVFPVWAHPVWLLCGCCSKANERRWPVLLETRLLLPGTPLEMLSFQLQEGGLVPASQACSAWLWLGENLKKSRKFYIIRILKSHVPGGNLNTLRFSKRRKCTSSTLHMGRSFSFLVTSLWDSYAMKFNLMDSITALWNYTNTKYCFQ